MLFWLFVILAALIVAAILPDLLDVADNILDDIFGDAEELS